MFVGFEPMLTDSTKAPVTRSWLTGGYTYSAVRNHDGVNKWKHFPRYWPFLRGNHRSPVNSPHKGQWRRTLMLSFTCARNKQLSKQSRRRWSETPLRSVWRQCKGYKSSKPHGLTNRANCLDNFFSEIIIICPCILSSLSTIARIAWSFRWHVWFTCMCVLKREGWCWAITRIHLIKSKQHIITSSNGNILRVTGQLCREFTSHRWIPHTKASDAKPYFDLLLNKLLSKQASGWWFGTPSRP